MVGEQQEGVYSCDDEHLGGMLKRLFDEGHDEVVVTHPIDGPIVVTRNDFKKHLANIKKAMNMSPADRIKETQRLKNIKNRKQIRFRTALINAPVCAVNIDDDNNFGKDIEGNKLDIEKMLFLPVQQYLPNTALKENEIGCFFDEFDEKRSPIRIVQAK